MPWEPERYSGLGMDALVTVCSGNTNVILALVTACSGTRTLLWFGRGCSGDRMLWEPERYSGLGMDALLTVCSGNTNAILV